MTDSLCLVIPMGTPYPALETQVRFHQILFNNLALCIMYVFGAQAYKSHF